MTSPTVRNQLVTFFAITAIGYVALIVLTLINEYRVEKFDFLNVIGIVCIFHFVYLLVYFSVIISGYPVAMAMRE